MRDSYSNYIEKLTGEYKAVFSDIEIYGLTMNMDRLFFEEKMSELLDIFMSAQEEKREIKSVIGEDVAVFCQNFFDEIPKTSAVREFFDSMKAMAWWVLAIDFVYVLSGANEESEISSYIAVFLLSYILSSLAGIGFRKLFAKDSRDYKKRRVLLIGMGLGIGVLLILFSRHFVGEIYIPITVEIGVLVGYLIVYYLVNHKRLKEAKETQGEVSFSELTAIEMSKEMRKRFEKQNQKRIKKGKVPYTWEEFVEKEEKATEKLPMEGRFYLVLPVILLAVSLLIGEYDTTKDMLIYSVLLLTIEYVLMGIFYKVNKSNYKARRKWGEAEKREMGDI